MVKWCFPFQYIIYFLILIFHLMFRIAMHYVIQNRSLRFGEIFYDEELKLCRTCRWHTHTHTHKHPHIYSSTRTQDHVITDLLTVISATSAFSTVGKQMLSDNRQLSNTATVRGHTHGPIRTPPSFRCCLNDTGYHVKGHLTHTVYKHAWDLFHHSS